MATTTAATPTTPTKEKSFPELMRQHLNELKASLERAQENIRAENVRVEAILRAKRDEARAAVEARRMEVDEARARMKARIEAKKVETDAAVAEWKAKRELQRLEVRADAAEKHADAALVVAWGAIEEADEAILDAIAARLDTENAKRAAGAMV
jgi:hypothetical protein